MNAKIIIGGMIFFTGAVSGSLITYFVMRNKFTRLYDDKINELLQTSFDDLQNRYDTTTVLTEEEMATLINNEEEENDMVSSNADSINPVDAETGIERITSEDMTDTCPDYDKVTLNYYAGDGVYTSDSDIEAKVDPGDKLSHVVDYIGDEAYNDIYKMTTDGIIDTSTESIYVRNHDMMTDYEIMLFPGKFE